MRRTSGFVARAAAISLAVAITGVVALAPQAHADTGQFGVGFTVTAPRSATTLPTSYIVKVGSSAIYYPSYLGNCVHNTTGAEWLIYNTTTVTQTVTDVFNNGAPITTIAPKSAKGFAVNATTFPTFAANGLASNPSTAVLIKCQ